MPTSVTGATQLFLADHARVHGSAMAEAEAINLGDVVWRDLGNDQLRLRLPGHSSIAWFLWHIARCEDVAINTVLRDRPQVLDEDDWSSQMRVERRDIGTAMTDEQVDALSSAVDLAALRAYRDAVGRATRAWAADLDLAALDTPVADAGRRSAAAGAFGAGAGWITDFWDGRTRGWFLGWLGVGHHYMHLAECIHIAQMLGATRQFWPDMERLGVDRARRD
jgi:hypothetical protein